MVAEILKITIKNIRFFFIVWAVVIAVNQLFIFGACFEGYCIAAALPHTSVIALFLTYFYHKEDVPEKSEQVSRSAESSAELEFEIDDQSAPVRHTRILCPKCGASMQKRIAKKGRFAGQEFFGCSKYPKCNGLVNFEQSNIN